MTVDDERTTWLAGLQASDLVVVVNSQASYHQVERVIRLTPAGYLIVTIGRGKITFDSDGLERTSTPGKSHLEPYNDASREIIERRQLVSRLKVIPWEKQTTDTLRAVLALIEQAARK